MANSVMHLITFRSVTAPSLLRRFSTVTETAKTVRKEKGGLLYRELTAVPLKDTNSNVTDTLDEWVKQGRLVSRFDIIAYVNLLRKFKKYEEANKIYGWMEKSKQQLNNADRAIRIDLISKTEGIESAENYFDSLQESAKTKKTYGSLLNCYSQKKMFEKATNLFEKMKELNLTSTLNYNSIMVLYLNVDQPEKVPLLVEEMEGKNIAADSYTYNHLLKSYASLKDLDAAEGVLEKMKNNKVKLDWFTLGTLATIYVNAGVIKKANATLKDIEELENLQDREAFNMLIRLYGEISNLDGVNRSWDSLKLIYPEPSNVSYLVMILTLSKLGQVDALEKYYREWESNCSNYDVRVANVILESYLKRDMIKEAELIYEKIEKSVAGPNLKTLESLTNFYVKKQQMGLALKYLEMGASKAKPENQIWFPTDETIRMFLSYFEKENDVEKAEKFCDSMKMIDRLDSTVYDSLLRTNVSAGK